MTTSALAMLRALVDSASSPDAKAEALARVAVCLAQLGRIEEARHILKDLRFEYSTGTFPRVSIRLMILEGVISYYESLVDSSDRVRRAYALAKVGGAVDLQAESSVWMAHLAFNFENYSVFEQSLSDALEGFANLDDSHRARICLLVADTLQYLADRSAASDWYSLARILSRKVHDHGIMTAIEYNRLGMGLSRIRVDRALGCESSSSSYRDWLNELGSVERLHIGFDARALSELLDLCGAYTHEIRGDFARASTILIRIRDSGSSERCGVSDRLLRIEIEWCRFKLTGLASQSDRPRVDRTDLEALSQNERLIALPFIRDLLGDDHLLFDADYYVQTMNDAKRHFEKTVSDMSEAIEVARRSYGKIRSLALSEGEVDGSRD